MTRHDQLRNSVRSEERRKRREDAVARAARARLNWGDCLVPECLKAAVPGLDRDRELPLCWDHSVQVWATVQRRNHLPEVIGIADRHASERAAADEARDLAEKQARKARQDGQIYLVRLNGLVKVGWSGDLRQRLRAYGPDVEILCHYPATRDDETNLHRQLTPYRARGREWYSEAQMILDLVAAAVEQHGPPTVKPDWTQPKQAIKLRQRTRY